MKYIYAILFAIGLILLSSCHSGQTVKELRQENDSLRMAKEMIERDVDLYFKTMYEIENDLKRIKVIEMGITEDFVVNGFKKTPSERIKQDFLEIEAILKKNQEKLAFLQTRLAESNLRIDEFELAVDRLSQTVDDKNDNIDDLYADLSKQAELIVQQEISIKGLKREKEEVTRELTKQEVTMNKAWYVATTLQALKDEDIITGGNLFNRSKLVLDDFDKSFFSEIDIRKIKTLPIKSKRVKVHSTHPRESYSLDRNSDGTYTLVIKDYKLFWSVMHFLIIQTD